MNLTLLGVKTIVPQRYPTYSDEQKAAILRHVHLLQKTYGDRLSQVNVDRLVRRGRGFAIVGSFAWKHGAAS